MIKWNAPEYHYSKKETGWYWLVITIATIVALIALWQKNFLFAVFTVVAAVILVAWGRREPQIFDFELSQHGLKIGESHYGKDLFSSFSIIEETEEWGKLLLKKKAKISSIFSVPIPRKEFDNIRNYCLNLWTEAELKESFVDEISKLLKF